MNPNDLDLRLLRSFLTVAQCGKISAAAKQLHLSQPAVTAHLRRLEEIVGKPLVSRSTRGVRLTREGHQLQNLAAEIQSTLSRIESSFHPEHKLGGELRIGASLTIASQVIPGFLVEFCRLNPGVVVDLRVDNTEVVLDSVRDGTYPFGLVEGNPRAAGLRLERFVEDEIVLVAGVNPNFTAYQRLVASITSVEDLKKAPLIWRELGSGTRAVVEKALRKLGIQTRQLAYQYTIADLQATKTMVMQGLGLAFLSRWSVREDVAASKLRIVRINDLIVRRGFYWVLPSGALGEPGDSFIRFCNDYRSKLAVIG